MSDLQVTIDNAFLALNRRSDMLFSFELRDANAKIDVYVDLGDGEKVQLLRSALTRTLSNPTRCQAVLDACLITATKMRNERGITTPAIRPEAVASGEAFFAGVDDFNVEMVTGASQA